MKIKTVAQQLFAIKDNMKRFLTIFWVLICTVVPSFSADLGTNEVKALLDRAVKVKEAMDRGDAEAVILMTHSSIYKLTNGKEKFEELTRQLLKQIKSLGITVIESSLGTPTRTYSSGKDTVCFIPRTSIMAVNGKKVRSIGFLIAVRSSDASDWLFLDGSGLRNNPDFLKTLLPGLPANISLPENRKELIK